MDNAIVEVCPSETEEDNEVIQKAYDSLPYIGDFNDEKN